MKKRCGWVGAQQIYIDYHDKEWGVPVVADCKLFEFLLLEGAQAGLNWLTVLKKRANYRTAFCQFDPQQIAQFGKVEVAKLLNNPGIIRNKLKIAASISNAQAFLELQKEFGSFAKYLWDFVGGVPLQNSWKTTKELPSTTSTSDALSKDLKARGFKFVGSTIVYAYMQAVGMVNDHTVDCFRYNECKKYSAQII